MRTEQALLDRVEATATKLERSLGAAIAAHGEEAEALREPVATALQTCLDQLAVTGCWGPANQLPSSRLWNIAGPLLQVGSLQLHAHQKPLGYAGDFQLLDRICRGDVTNHPVGKAMDWFFQEQAAPRAVRNRARLIAAAIRQLVERQPTVPLSIASIGSGPAWDLRWALESLTEVQRNAIRVTLVDLDPRALQFCQTQLAGLIPPAQLQLERANLKRLPRLSSTLNRLAGADLVFCAGFFDYLEAPVATTMLQALWQAVGPRGELLVFNFSEQNPSRAYMEWIGNWYLVYRTAEMMDELAHQANLAGATHTVGVEPENVNLFLRFQKARTQP